MINLDEQIVKEILKLAHKLPSPKSVIDKMDDNVQDSDAAKVNELAYGFLMRVIRLSLLFMQQAGYSMSIFQCFIAEALEYFIKNDCVGYRHSYMLDNDDSVSDQSSMDSDWEPEEYSDEEDIHESDHRLPVNHINSVMYTIDPRKESNDYYKYFDSHYDSDVDEIYSDCWSSEDEDEMEERLNDFASRTYNTPTFDATFPPISAKKVKVTNDSFRWHMNMMPIGNFDMCVFDIPDSAVEKLKLATYSYVIASLK
jgi:hypothetical protein